MDTVATRWSEADERAVRGQLARIVASGAFAQSQRRQRFLNYVVEETLAGRGDRLKGYSVGVEVFGRPADFDPAIDPIVRIEATRLRDKLRDYYSTEGRNDPVRIELPKGSYAPLIELQAASAPTPEAGVTEPPAASEPALHPEESLKQVARPHYWPIRYPAGKAVLAAATGGALLGVFLLWPETSPTPPRPEKASIAVLPFTTIGDDATWNRFAYGVTEDIVADLAQSKDLFVVARNSTEVYRGKAVDVREVGSALGVKYVLEGSIQPSSTHIKVTTQLIDARTGGHVWSSRYHRPVTDLFEVQRDVTEKIAATLAGYQGAVVQAERTLIRRKRPGSLTAYEYYLLGMEAKHGGASGAVTKEGPTRPSGYSAWRSGSTLNSRGPMSDWPTSTSTGWSWSLAELIPRIWLRSKQRHARPFNLIQTTARRNSFSDTTSFTRGWQIRRSSSSPVRRHYPRAARTWQS